VARMGSAPANDDSFILLGSVGDNLAGDQASGERCKTSRPAFSLEGELRVRLPLLFGVGKRIEAEQRGEIRAHGNAFGWVQLDLSLEWRMLALLSLPPRP